MDETERRLWQRLARLKRKSLRDHVRNQLCERYLRLAARMATAAYSRTPGTITYDELYSAACEGLLQAIPRFDLSRNLRPSTFLAGRIRGAILDYLRSLDHVPRLRRLRRNQVDRYAAQLGRTPTDEEIQDRFGYLPQQTREVKTHSLEDIPGGVQGERPPRYVDMLPARTTHTSTPAIAEDLGHLLRGLSARERLIVLLYHVEGYRMSEIAESLGCSESRISQLMKQTYQRLRQNAAAA